MSLKENFGQSRDSERAWVAISSRNVKYAHRPLRPLSYSFDELQHFIDKVSMGPVLCVTVTCSQLCYLYVVKVGMVGGFAVQIGGKE